jgi:FixJ family two-component response regulator
MQTEQIVFIVDDDEGVRQGLSLLLETINQPCEAFGSATDFLDAYEPSKSGCLVLDIRMPRMTGLDLQEKLIELGSSLPIIFISGHGDIPMAVEAMRRGALDFIRKPFREQDLLDSISEALEYESGKHQELLNRQELEERITSLTERELQVFHRVAEGEMNKVIGFGLGISERTVEVHRSQVMKKLRARTLAQLVRIKIKSEISLDSQ